MSGLLNLRRLGSITVHVSAPGQGSHSLVAVWCESIKYGFGREGWGGNIPFDSSSWDPKETWALLTWLIFAIYLHARITKGWQGKKPAIIASFGFLAIWVCFLGVNLIGEGLHSYGWFSLS